MTSFLLLALVELVKESGKSRMHFRSLLSLMGCPGGLLCGLLAPACAGSLTRDGWLMKCSVGELVILKFK